METMTLPPAVETSLGLFTEAAKAAFAPDLKSLVLFGSAAEGRWRPASDVNLLVVLSDFGKDPADRMRSAYAAAHSAVRLNVMYIRESEVAEAADLFAVKFMDIGVRHQVLFGSDPFASLAIQPEAAKRRLRQVLTNLILRTRERYILSGADGASLSRIIAEVAGPLRACAMAMDRLEGRDSRHPKEALAELAARLGLPGSTEALETISEARSRKPISTDEGGQVVFFVLQMAERMRGLVETKG